ncbi:MAG: beta-ketoacyl-ACP synthase 3 [Gammaproteobacteria bacterium]|nr:beta-ketoacyl-ACP synthase 3 [Gammaproteobacteria bacterium]
MESQPPSAIYSDASASPGGYFGRGEKACFESAWPRRCQFLPSILIFCQAVHVGGKALFFSRISAIATQLPSEEIPNSYFGSYLDTSDQWIAQRTGIQSRFWLKKNESVLDITVPVLAQLIEKSGRPDSVIVATCSADKVLPSLAHRVASACEIDGLHFDVNAACSGFLVALAQARALIGAGMVSRVAVIGADAMSKLIDHNDRATAVLFGDGAGGLMLERAQQDVFLSTCFDSKVAFCDILMDQGRIHEGVKPVIQMQGQEVYRLAVGALSRSVLQSLHLANKAIEDVDFVFAHQANDRILQSVAKNLGIDDQIFYKTVNCYGNTSAASIPLGLAHAHENNRLKNQDILVLTAIGAGMAWGSMVLKWEEI